MPKNINNKNKNINNNINNKSIFHNNVKVVYAHKGLVFRTILTKDQYKTLESGQIKLPENYYSSGYYERISGCNWNELPELIETDTLNTGVKK